MCKCEIGKCAYAVSQLLDGKINCSIRGATVPLKRCSDYVSLVEIEDININKIAIVNAKVNCPICNSTIELNNIEIDKMVEITCTNCETIFMCIYYSNWF